MDPRAKRAAAFVKYAVILAVGFFVSPFIWAAIGGLLGLIAAAAIMTTTWVVIPWLGAVAANLRIKLIKAEAAKNPVETLQAEHLRQAEQLEIRGKGLTEQGKGLRTFETKISTIEKRFPDDPSLPQMHKDLANLTRAWEGNRGMLQKAIVQHERFATEIERASMLWDAAIAGAAARKQIVTEDEWMATLKTNTALDSIRDALSETMSALDTDMMEMEAKRQSAEPVNVTPSPAQLQAPDDHRTIEIPSLKAKTRR